MVLVGGDFNSDLKAADQYGLKKWSAEAGLTEASTGEWSERPSFVRPSAVGVSETRIDHVFTTDMTAILSCSPIDPEFLISHHRPLLTRVDIEYCARREVYHGLKRVNMLFCPTSRANRIGAVCSWLEESDLLDWGDPEAFLEFVGVHTVKACTLSKGIRKEKDGWSPITKGLTMNLRAIVTMLRHVHGYQSYKNLRWTEVNFKPGLHAILRRWRQHGRKIAHTGELQDAYLNLCRFGEQFWLHASWDLLISSLAEAYRVVKSMLHGAARSRRRTEVSALMAKVQAAHKNGKTGMAIRYALGPKNRGFDLSSLNIEGEEITDQGIINEAAANHMRKWFAAASFMIP